MHNLSKHTVCIHEADKTVQRLLGAAPIPREERTETMNGLILFMLGCFLGGFLGVTVMCLLQINRLNHYEMKDKEEKTTDEEKL